MSTVMGLVCLKPDLDIIENIERRDTGDLESSFGSVFDHVTYRKTDDDNVMLLWEDLPDDAYENLIDTFAELVEAVMVLSMVGQPYELIIAQGIGLTYEASALDSRLKLHLNPRVCLTKKEA